MKKIIGAILAAAALSPVLAQAQQSYVGVNVGTAEQKGELGIFSGEEDDTAFKLYGGYQFNANFGVELGHAWLGKAEFPLSGTVLTTKPRALYVAGTATLPLNAQFSLFGKLGVTHNRVKYETFGLSGRTDSTNRALAGIGAAYAFTPTVSGVIEFEHYGKMNDDGGSIKARFLSAGIRASF